MSANTSELEYDKAAFFYDEIMNAFIMDFSFYNDLVEILKPDSVLELGCGMGRLFSIFLKTANVVTGIDLSEEMLAEGRKYFADRTPDNAVTEFIQADIRSFSLERKYDLIVMALSVLKHLSSEEDRLAAIANARNHLSDNGFLAIDTTPYLYTSESTSWINAADSMVASWVPDRSILAGYQWKKTVDGNNETLHWRYHQNEQTQFEHHFTVYPYKLEQLFDHIARANMYPQQLLTEWEANGLGTEGKRFIGLVSRHDRSWESKQQFLERVAQRDRKLWSDHQHYLQAHR
ncbi:class I SAM-dependent methyltransferase [Roseofilum casamattae]|uniref:Class I SAM-dependent methyltransferase n=1 Tax=Roseofilum casamattae BLCC-M143 TaxID=3022442 RepID=A0ABT7BY14_9CYAN|nr:class I SAM-dependent methyltransferase [Roseofilum casamattae]MDJ1183173.1 class I SAM-dependent methyltransferase [Roseofilum casamattae BLCC-M143]